jgi:hypothetical protein
MDGAPPKSKKPSSGKITAQQRLRETSVFYLDENLSDCKPIQAVFESAGIKFERHLTHFARGTDDVDWLSFVGKKGWIVVTKDKSQRYNPLEKAEIQKYRIKQFAFQSGNLSAIEMAALLEANLRKIFNLIRRHPPPFVASITKSGVNPKTLSSD